MEEKEFYIELGKQVKALREKHDLNPAQFAKKIGIPRSLLVSFEEEGKKLSAWRINKILKYFDLGSIDDLFQPEKKTLSISASHCRPITA